MRPNKVRSVASSNSVKGAAKKAMIEGEEGGLVVSIVDWRAAVILDRLERFCFAV